MGRKRINYTFVAAVLLLVGLVSGAVTVVRHAQWESGESARAVRCLSNMRQIGSSLRLYADRNGGHYPDDLSATGMNDAAVLTCPSNRDSTANPSYRYLGKGLTTTAPADTPLLCEVRAYHPLADSRLMNVLFADGRVETLREQDAEKLISKSPQR